MLLSELISLFAFYLFTKNTAQVHDMAQQEMN